MASKGRHQYAARFAQRQSRQRCPLFSYVQGYVFPVFVLSEAFNNPVSSTRKQYLRHLLIFIETVCCRHLRPGSCQTQEAFTGRHRTNSPRSRLLSRVSSRNLFARPERSQEDGMQNTHVHSHTCFHDRLDQMKSCSPNVFTFMANCEVLPSLIIKSRIWQSL
jgi:hypothetical protein